MISIIICTRSTEISTTLACNIQNTVGCEYELIVVDNSENQHSIFSAYNIGVSRSRHSFLCFIHEDVEFKTLNWGLKVQQHLNVENTGLIGIAGGQAALRVPLGWTSYNPFYNITHTHSFKSKHIADKKESSPKHNSSSIPVVLLDGVFLCAKKELFDHIKYDEGFSGFHGYDLDISLQAVSAGYQNRVVYDIDLLHFSRGHFDSNYIQTLLRTYEKWNEQLPIFEKSLTDKKIKCIQYKAERSTLLRLRKRMIRAGMPSSEINSTISRYTLITGNRFDKFMLFLLPAQYVFIRITSIIRRKMIHQHTL